MKRHKGRLWGLALLCLVAVFSANRYSTQTPAMQINETIKGIVTRVVDGDSLYVDDKKLRLWGVDAPEEGQFGYEQAKSTLRNMVLHKTLSCTCLAIDKYGRNIAMCQFENGHDIGDLLIRTGWALDYYKHTRGYYSKAEDEAKTNNRGLWAPR